MNRGVAVRAVAVAAGLTLAAALVAMAGRYPLGHAAPVDAASARTPLTILVFGGGLVGLAALVLIWPLRRRRRDELEDVTRESSEIPWWAKVLAVLVPLAVGAALVAAVVAGAGARHASLGAGGGVGGFGLLPVRAPHHPAQNVFVLPGWLPWTVLAIVVAAVTAAVAVVLVRGRRLVDGEAEPDGRAPARAAVAAALDALDPGRDPRAAVIAAYAAMERALAARGVARRPAEAPREYLRRVLATGRAARQDAILLTDLFEEARFSTHPIGEPVRASARSALDSLRAALTAGEAG